MSEYLNRNKETYIDRMRGVSWNGEWEAWISFFITGIKLQAREAYERSLKLRDLEREYTEKYGGMKVAAARLALKLFEQPYITAKDVKRMLAVTGPTAYRAIHSLEDDGVLEEVTGKKRDNEYRAVESFEIIERPPATF